MATRKLSKKLASNSPRELLFQMYQSSLAPSEYNTRISILPRSSTPFYHSNSRQMPAFKKWNVTYLISQFDLSLGLIWNNFQMSRVLLIRSNFPRICFGSLNLHVFNRQLWYISYLVASVLVIIQCVVYQWFGVAVVANLTFKFAVIFVPDKMKDTSTNNNDIPPSVRMHVMDQHN